MDVSLPLGLGLHSSASDGLTVSFSIQHLTREQLCTHAYSHFIDEAPKRSYSHDTERTFAKMTTNASLADFWRTLVEDLRRDLMGLPRADIVWCSC